ncbi:MAG: putative DNA-binding domain-containing protein [Rhodospirillales bacterium]|nr:MAG: putative DNA-binding domain-containing protein [Rhodospirillales bacterium]
MNASAAVRRGDDHARPTLLDVQRAFRTHILDGDAPDLAARVVADRIDGGARLAVYRHHVLTSLAAALAATFATVERVVGSGFFGALARRHVVAHPPAAPVLAEYGAAFPAFVAADPACATLPYLADVARLDWALNRAYNAPAEAALTAATLAAVPADAIGALRLRHVGSVSIVESPYPIDRIWTLGDDSTTDPVDLGAGGAALLVFQRDDDAAFAPLSAGELAFHDALRSAGALAAAYERACAVDPAFDLGGALARALALGVLRVDTP